MSELSDLIDGLLMQGAELSIDDGKVRIRAPEGALPPQTIERLRRDKEQILELLPTHCLDAPLSVGQEGLWFIQESAPDSSAYNVGFALHVRAAADPAPALARCLQRLVNRHALLRTTFGMAEGRPRQRVRAYAAVTLAEADATAQRGLAEVIDAAMELVRRPFRTEAEGAFRACFFRRGPTEGVLLLVVHHIVCDGWSFRMLIDELLRLYEADGAAAALAPVQHTYQQFVAWERDLLARREDELRRFWEAELAGAALALNLPTDRVRPPVQTFRGATHAWALPPALAAALRKLAREQQTTLSTIFLSAFVTLLHRYCAQEDLCVGAIMAGRDEETFAGVFGYLVNQIVIRSQIDAAAPPRFGALVAAIRARMLAAMTHQMYPFPRLVQDLRGDRDLSRPPVVQAMFVYQRVQLLAETTAQLLGGKQVTARGAQLAVLPLPHETSELELILEVTEQPDGVELAVRYNRDLFEAATIGRLAQNLETLLAGVAADPDRPLPELPLLTAAERAQVVSEWNQTELAHDRRATVHQLVEAQAARTPEAPAVYFEGRAISYRELNQRANRLARSLRAQGVAAGARVGVCLARTPDLIVSLLAVLKAGAAYVPIDPAYPQARQALMVEEAGVELLLAAPGPAAALASASCKLLVGEPGPGGAAVAGASAAEPDAGADLGLEIPPDALAYLMTTSGSTGRPKAVAIEHRNVVALLRWAEREFPAADLRGMLASTSVCFDLSVFELFLPLAVGGAVILADHALALPRLAGRERVTLLNTVPSAAAELAQIGAIPDGVRVICLAGEKLSGELVQRLYRLPHVERIYNLYGPTEATVYATWTLVRRGDEREPTIGRPVANTRAYVLDAFGQPVPIGVAGELYLGGEGVGRGYWNRPELTQERFVTNPLDPGRLYRTGDLVRYRADGELEFLGRLDNQVKLRGFRIELGEIEAALERIEGVDKAIVVVHGTGPRQHLVAYVSGAVATSGEAGTTALQSSLSRALPAYMVPDVYVPLAAFPLSPNGKIDRRALPAPSAAERGPGEHREPRGAAEEALAAIWREVLGVEKIGARDNFFQLGGHSLLVVQVLDRVRAQLNVELPLRAMFELATIEAMARHLETGALLRQLVPDRPGGPDRPGPGGGRQRTGRL